MVTIVQHLPLIWVSLTGLAVALIILTQVYNVMNDYSAIWRDDASEEEFIAAYQSLIDNGQAWKLEGHVGRTAMDLIESGYCILGEEGHYDYYGNYIPSRNEVIPGTKGSKEYAEKMRKERDDV